VLDLIGDASLLDGCDGIAASDDGDGSPVRRHGFGDLCCAVGEGRHFEDAHRPVPNDRRCCGNLLLERGDGLRADVQRHPLRREWSIAGERLRLRVSGKLVGEDVIHRKQKAHAARLRLRQCFFRDVDFVSLEQRFADLLPFSF
jgi:hypothetical protein